MDEKLFFVLLAIVLFVFLGPLKISDLRIKNGERYQRDNLRYNTPGRNQRQRQLAQDREDRKMGQPRSKEEPEASAPPQESEIVEDPEIVANRSKEVFLLLKFSHQRFISLTTERRNEHVALPPQKLASRRTNRTKNWQRK
jgi:hypothetical protein